MINNIINLKERIAAVITKLQEASIVAKKDIDKIYLKRCDYKQDNSLPDVENSGTEFKNGEQWGGEADTHYWFYTEITLDKEIDKGEVRFVFDTYLTDDWEKTYPQFLVYLDGKLKQGVDSNHNYIVLKEKKTYGIHIYAYTGMYFKKKINLNLQIQIVDKETERLIYNLLSPFQILSFTKENVGDFKNILEYLNKTINCLDWRERNFNNSVKKANQFIEKEFYQKYCGKGLDTDFYVDCVGHTHIDIAWLWTKRQTIEKAQRSFSIVTELMNEYPDYKFMSSQPFLYEACKSQAPELYEEIKKRVKEGKWEPEGAMWVEADCNLTSGESLVRQILYGKEFFKKEFNVDSEILWLVDVFGYTAALPQIMKKSGINYFLTSKISWNDTNTMPNDTFLWQGIDGSEVFTYFLTAQDMKTDRSFGRFATYSAHGNASQVAGTWNAYRNKELSKEAIMTYGYGDGGGGSTKEDIENIKRLQYGIPGCPKARFSSAREALHNIRRQAIKSKRLQKWVGELYFEYHRGTLTTQAVNKRNNRKAEFALQNLETMAAICAETVEYPKAKIDELWKILLTNQFHDIIPGSGIKEIYEDSEKEYLYFFDEIKKLANCYFNNIRKVYGAVGKNYLVFNPNSFTAEGIVETENGKRFVKGAAPKGFSALPIQPLKNRLKLKPKQIENDFFCIKFANDYSIISIYDKRNKRQLVKKGQSANEFRIYEDLPMEYDAWELRDYYIEKSYPVKDVVSAEVYLDGCTGGLMVVKKFGDSTIRQRIRIYEDIDRIDFETEVDWHSKHSLLKVLFPVDINTDYATFDIQFGNIQRPTHQNTSWDRAKFESCGHKFVDLSESDFGISMLNDCKYGYSVIENVIGLSLLRGATYPNPDSDVGVHTFTYSLYPHTGALRNSEAEKQAFMLNNPVTVIGKTEDIRPFSFVQCSDERINIGAVKKAEEGNGFIVRLNETNNMRHKIRLNFGKTIESAFICDLMEQKEKRLAVANNEVLLEIKPFEIITLMVE